MLAESLSVDYKNKTLFKYCKKLCKLRTNIFNNNYACICMFILLTCDYVDDFSITIQPTNNV